MHALGARETARGGSGAAPLRQVVALAALSTVGQVSTFIYLPSLPAIASEFASSEVAVQLTVTTYLVGSCASLLAYGSLSDRYGRMPVLAWGAAIYVAASIGCALAGDVLTLAAARLAQGVGATAGPMLARAMARDLCGPAETARVLAHMSMVQVLAPMLGPVLGAVVHETLGWRANFVLIAAGGVVATVIAWRMIGETHHARQTGGFLAMARSYPLLLGARAFVGPVVVGSALTGAFFGFMVGAPFVFMTHFAATPGAYAAYTMVIFAGFVVGAFAASRRVVRDGIARTAAIGAPILGVSVLVMMALALAGGGSVLTLLLPLAVAMLGMGFMVPTSNAAAVGAFPHIAGAAAALLALIQMAVGAAASALVGVAADGTPMPMVLIVGLCSLAAVAAWWTLCAPVLGARESGPS